MLVRLLYASRASGDLGTDALGSILRKSRENNAGTGITGVLCYCATSGIFLQVLEGGRAAVSSLYNRIVRDPRHVDVELMSYAEIGERQFSGWSMGRVDMGKLNPALVLKYSSGTLLDPYAVSGSASLSLLQELVATASVGALH